MEFEIHKVSIKRIGVILYGKKIINDNLPVLRNEQRNITIPNHFKFNSNWIITFECLKCKSTLQFGQNFENNKIELTRIENLNSKSYNSTFLEIFLILFENLELNKVDNTLYLNRKDFNYEFDFQKMSSVSFLYYCCDLCSYEYLAKIRIGLPQLPERNIPFGEYGIVEIDEIINVKTSDGKMFTQLVSDNRKEKS